MSERAVVTAGTGGIGLETAKGLARHGFAVTVVGRNAERARAPSRRSRRSRPEPHRDS